MNTDAIENDGNRVFRHYHTPEIGRTVQYSLTLSLEIK